MIVRMPMAPPPSIVIEFEWRGVRLTTTVNQPQPNGHPAPDEWTAGAAWTADGARYDLTVEISSGESVVRLWSIGRTKLPPVCACLLAMRPVPRPREVPIRRRSA